MSRVEAFTQLLKEPFSEAKVCETKNAGVVLGSLVWLIPSAAVATSILRLEARYWLDVIVHTTVQRRTDLMLMTLFGLLLKLRWFLYFFFFLACNQLKLNKGLTVSWRTEMRRWQRNVTHISVLFLLPVLVIPLHLILKMNLTSFFYLFFF